MAVSRLLSVNYYDKIATLRNLPFLPDLDARYVWPPPPRVCLFERNIFDSIDTAHAHTRTRHDSASTR